MPDPIHLTPEERDRYAWQMSTPDIGPQGQAKLKAARVLISRVGGVGGAAALYLAAAGIGKLILAHAGNVTPPDLNRQILMTTDSLDQPRMQSARRQLHDLNPNVEVETIEENITPQNAANIVNKADLIIDAAPLFTERLALNQQSVHQRKPMIEAAMFDFDVQATTFIPGQTPCLACLVPEMPDYWKRQFPVFGAVAGFTGTLAAIEAIKVITGIGQPLAGKMLLANLREMRFNTLNIKPNPQCAVCGKARP